MIIIVKSSVPITAVYPLFGLLLLTEHFFASPAAGPLTSLVVAIFVTFIGFFGVILIPASGVTDRLVLILEIAFIWVLFAILQKLSEIIARNTSQYEEQLENLKIATGEFQEKLNELPQELDKFTKQKDRLSKLNTIATELGSILNRETLIDRIKQLAEKFIGHGTVVVSLLTETYLTTDDPICQWVLSNRYPLHIRNILTDGVRLKISKDIQMNYLSSIAAPVRIFDKFVGYIQFKDSQSYSDEEFRLFLIFNSIAEIALTNAELFAKTQELAITDGLTGLFVHGFFKERLSEEFYRAKSYNLPLSLVMIDIDHFKNLNDTYGHKAGDEILKQLAQILKKNFREIDIVARYGGEEFAVLMLQTSSEDAFNAVEKVRNLVRAETFLITEPQEETLLKKFLRLKITISAGIAGIGEGSIDIEDTTAFINNADNALYRAKSSGRDRVER
ncbi:MAG: sensor domain-containing diguanylate cyclase [Elusimicrobiota bacterium]|nr:sensor domain-containing diguanylate cyclase [Elusimicrobiota bacterium]